MLLRTISTLSLAIALAATAQAQTAQAEPASREFPAKLAGHAVLPAASFVEMPKDAPADLAEPGKFTNAGARLAPGTQVEGKSFGRPTGMKMPFKGQPLQGHSGIKRNADGTYWVLTDNGFGSKITSPDSALYLNRYGIDFESGKVERKETVFLRDPDRKVPFRIANEATEARYLTGADFDPESFQIVGGKFWIGEEFGPYLVRADMSGKIEAVFPTTSDGKPVRSPDNSAVTTPAAPGTPVDFNLRRSKGFEGMASSKDGRFLYPLLEGPIWDAASKDWEKTDGKTYLRILEFDVQAAKWTGRHWKYVLEASGNAIGDFNMIDATTALVIERDDGEGVPEKACPEGQNRTDCFRDLPKFKRVYKIEFGDQNANGVARKIGYVDLLKIADPDKKARKPLSKGAFVFPFFTIENVEQVDAEHIIVGNDNNAPFSTSREPNQQDDNEFILLSVPEMLKAK